MFAAKGACRHLFPVLTRHGSQVMCSLDVVLLDTFPRVVTPPHVSAPVSQDPFLDVADQFLPRHLHDEGLKI